MNIFFTVLLQLLLLVQSNSNEEWILVKSKDNIDVFVRQEKKGDFKEVRILTHIHCSMQELVASLEDVNAHKEWVMNTIDSKMIKTLQPWEFYYYISTDMPFPIKDRDLVVHYQRRQDEQTGIVYTKSTAAPGQYPMDDDFIRIKLFESDYILTPESGDLINIEYRMKVDPGGILPAWLVNLAVTKGPINTIESLFELIESKKYKNATVSAISEY